MNYVCAEEHDNPNADLRRVKGNTYCGGSAEEERCRSLVKVRVMQRPKLDEDEGCSGDGGGPPVADGARGRRCKRRMEKRPSRGYL